MESNKDPRNAYIANIASAMFGAPQLASVIAASPEVAKFMNELNQRVI
jgi:hypothetical protein